MEKEDILGKMKLLMSHEEKDEVIEFFVDRSIEMVKAYCNILVIPNELYGTCASIAATLCKTKEESIKSIQEGLITLTFQENPHVYDSETEILKQFSQELKCWRRFGF